MREISRMKKLEVAQYYILGFPYSETENRTNVSHGSVVNIVKELELGKLTIPGTPFDQVNDLHQLSLELKKKGLDPSQALLGILLYDRFQVLEITPELVDEWSELTKKLLPVDFPAKDFLEAALRLNELEKAEGKLFETLTVEYVRMKERADKLKLDIDSLFKKKEELTQKAKPLRSELESLERAKGRLKNAVDIQTNRLNELKSKTKETEEERSRLSKEVQDLQRRKTKLSSEVDGREESLRRLNDIGLSDEDLLRITDFVERTSKNEGINGNALKNRFLSIFRLFEDVSGLENQQKAKTQQVNEFTKKESTLSGEIIKLNKEKGLLEGEITTIVTSSLQRIRAVGEDATSQMQQQANAIKEQLNTLLADTLKAGEAVGEMRQALRKGEDLERNLSNFIEEVQNKVGRN